MIVVDTSVFVDSFFEYDAKRTLQARKLFDFIQERNIGIVEPFLFKIEFIGQWARRMHKNEALIASEKIFHYIQMIPNNKLFNLSFSIALETGCRAADAYFISTAIFLNTLLISNDQKQVTVAKTKNINSFYLIEQNEQIYHYLEKSLSEVF